MNKFGLIGFPLSHSFSKKYFTEKFQELGISETNMYELFELEHIKDLDKIFKENPNLLGLNVTIPHKVNILPFLDEIDPDAAEIGAVNVVKIDAKGRKIGYNSDYFGFKKSLEEFIPEAKNIKALVLGNGGAAKAVTVALKHLQIPFELVSRRKTEEATISYFKANNLLNTHKLVINCTPLGTSPVVNECPDLDYEVLSSSHYFHDLIYNPGETLFMKKAKDAGAHTKNGYDMLVFQAEKSWEIWNKE